MWLPRNPRGLTTALHSFAPRRSSWREVVPREMEEDRRGEADRVDAIEDAAVTFDDGAEILDAAIALHGRHHQSPEEPHERDGGAHPRGLQRRKRRHPPERGADQDCRPGS